MKFLRYVDDLGDVGNLAYESTMAFFKKRGSKVCAKFPRKIGFL